MKTTAMKIAEFMRTQRKAYDYTIERLAVETGLSYNTIRQLEKGRPGLTLRAAMLVADAFGVELSEITGKRWR